MASNGNCFSENVALEGPSCIRLNQSALRPRKQQEIELKNEHQEITAKVRNHLVEFHHVPRTQPIFEEYSSQLLHYLYGTYFAPLPYRDQLQAREQAHIVASIPKQLNPFDEILNKVIQFLHDLRSKKLIFKWHYDEMMVPSNRAHCELAHLYFNPKTHKVHSTRTDVFPQ